MQEKKSFSKIVEEICTQDSRYKPDAYEFIMQALHFTQKRQDRQGHVTGRELSEGIRDFIIEQYGPMAKTVLDHWGIKNTLDFGSIVFNMIKNKLMSKQETDSIDDFKDVYDFETAFNNVLEDTIKP